jgi:hypothetical protein
LLEAFREMFDVATLYKPVKIVVEEKKSILFSLLYSFVYLVFFVVITAALTLIFNFQAFFEEMLWKSIAMFFVVLAFLASAPFPLVLVFVVSRFIVKSKNRFEKLAEKLIELFSAAYFITASLLPFFLIIFIPFGEFAGMLFFVLGIALYFYFLNLIFEKVFSTTPFQSMVLLIVYILPWFALATAIFAILLFLNVLPFQIL